MAKHKLTFYFLPLLFFTFLGVVISGFLNDEETWIQPERAYIAHQILKSDGGLQGRLSQAFNFHLFESRDIKASRARILSHLWTTVDTLFRHGLFKWIRPHPSLSINWLLALLLCPLLMALLMMRLTGDRSIAWLCTLLFLCAPGNLIPVMMLFHPGKTIVNTLALLLLLAGHRTESMIRAKKTREAFRNFCGLVALAAVSLLFDEYALFIIVLLPVFFPRMLLHKKGHLFAAAFLFLPIFYILSLNLFLPAVYSSAGFHDFDFYHYARLNEGLPRFNASHFFLNFLLMAHDHLSAGPIPVLRDPSLSMTVTAFNTPHNQLNHPENIRIAWDLLVLPGIRIWNWLYQGMLLIFLTILGISAGKNWREQRREPIFLWLRAGAVLLILTAFISYIHRLSNILSGCWYYGSLFSVFFVILLGLSFQVILRAFPASRMFQILITVLICIFSLQNIKETNTALKVLHYRDDYPQLDMWLNRLPRCRIDENYRKTAGVPAHEMIARLWDSREDPELFRSYWQEAPQEIRALIFAETGDLDATRP